MKDAEQAGARIRPYEHENGIRCGGQDPPSSHLRSGNAGSERSSPRTPFRGRVTPHAKVALKLIVHDGVHVPLRLSENGRCYVVCQFFSELARISPDEVIHDGGVKVPSFKAPLATRVNHLPA